MSSDSSRASQPRIFTKSNLVYIPLSITIAHTLNFIFNSPLSIWKEFPPKLPRSIYASIYHIPLLLFISLTFEPIQTRKRFYTLLSCALLFISIPISFREANYSPLFHRTFATLTVFYGFKMLLFLKFNRAYLNQNNLYQKKEFKPYILTLFNWRVNSYIIPPTSENSNEKENPLIIKSPTTSQINKKLFNCLIIIIIKLFIFDLTIFILLISTKV